MAGRTRRTPKTPARDQRFDLFLEALSTGETISGAAKTAGFDRRADVYERRLVDERFAERWDEIIEATTQTMEAEAYRRAVDGWVERVEFTVDPETGERIPTVIVRKHSDTLLIFLLKARRPETYRERVEHTGAGGGPVEHRMQLDLRGLTDEQLAALEAIQPSDDAGSTDKD